MSSPIMSASRTRSRGSPSARCKARSIFQPRCANASGCSPGSTSASSSSCLDERVHLTSGAVTLVQTMRAGGASCLLVSGGFLSFAEPVARTVGFDRVKANRLVFAGGKLSGEVGDPIVDAIAKREALIEVRDELGLSNGDVLAIGDGANDKMMIEEAGLGIAFRAKPALVEVADAELKYHGLDALLWVQGVQRQDWFRI